MRAESKDVIQDAPWLKYTYKIIGFGMEAHNELGPGHREAVYHDAMVVKCGQADLSFEDEPFIPVTLDDGTVVGGNSPDLVVEQLVTLSSKPARTS